jgi:hypothetical protein
LRGAGEGMARKGEPTPELPVCTLPVSARGTSDAGEPKAGVVVAECLRCLWWWCLWWCLCLCTRAASSGPPLPPARPEAVAEARRAEDGPALSVVRALYPPAAALSRAERGLLMPSPPLPASATPAPLPSGSSDAVPETRELLDAAVREEAPDSRRDDDARFEASAAAPTAGSGRGFMPGDGVPRGGTPEPRALPAAAVAVAAA